jgi:UPF0755 protein
MAKTTDKNRKYKRTVSGFENMISILMVVLVVVVFIGLARISYVFGYNVFNEQAMAEEPGEDVTVTIPADSSALSVGRILKKAGLIENEWIFMAQERLSAYHDEIKPGTYTLNTSETPTQMMAIMAPEEDESGSGKN